MRWTAVVPLKAARDRKSRLATMLDSDERIALSERMATHVLAVLHEAAVEALILSPVAWPGSAWRRDGGGGLNRELQRLRTDLRETCLLVLHADLPLVTADDVRALVGDAERCGIAIAPDRHRRGTNAIAIADARTFEFAFGADSFRRHREQAGAPAASCERAGLALDVDTPEDLAEAIRRGFRGARATS